MAASRAKRSDFEVVTGIPSADRATYSGSIAIRLSDIPMRGETPLLPRGIANREALYAFVWRSAPAHLPLFRTLRGGVLRFGSASQGYLRGRCREGIRALLWDGDPRAPFTVRHHSLAGWRSAENPVALSELELVITYGECAQVAEAIAVRTAARVSGYYPPGNQTNVGVRSGRFHSMRCFGHAGCIGGGEVLFRTFEALPAE